MKKIIFAMLLSLMFTLTSCVTGAFASTYDDGITDVSVIFTYGTPYRVNGSILYYIYNGYYYYPYYNNNTWYFYRYSRPIPNITHFRPHPHHRPYGHFQPHRGHHGSDWGHRPPRTNHGNGGAYRHHNGHGGGHFGHGTHGNRCGFGRHR